MQQHCQEMNEIISMVQMKYDILMMQKVKDKQAKQNKDIENLRNLILN